MILKIKYQIRFPLGSFLKDDPKYLIIKKIYSEIRRILCVNDNNCKECSKKDRCLYYLLSGNNFETYPSILVKRNFLEKKNYKSNETFELEIFLIGIASSYLDFVTEYLKTIDYIGDAYIQKKQIDLEYIDESETIDGNIVFNGLIRDIDEVIKCLKIYSEKYSFKFNDVEIEEIERGRYLIDYTKYFINGKYFENKGYQIKAKVKNYPKVLLDIGIGSFAILGGGTALCVSE